MGQVFGRRSDEYSARLADAGRPQISVRSGMNGRTGTAGRTTRGRTRGTGDCRLGTGNRSRATVRKIASVGGYSKSLDGASSLHAGAPHRREPSHGLEADP
jgi:hypothetical protein